MLCCAIIRSDGRTERAGWSQTAVECRPDHFNTPKYVLSASAVARDIVRFRQRNSGTDSDADPETTTMYFIVLLIHVTWSFVFLLP